MKNIESLDLTQKVRCYNNNKKAIIIDQSLCQLIWPTENYLD